jgi:hypothetical protein
MSDLADGIGQLTAKWRATARLAEAAGPNAGGGLVNMATLTTVLDACADEADATVALAGPAAAPAQEAPDGGFAASVRAASEAFMASVTGRRT